MKAPSLIQTAISSAKWALIARVSQVLGRAVMLLVLPFWLMPDDFGVVTMFTSVLALLVILQQAGLVETVIQREKDIREVREGAFWLGVLTSLIIYVGLYLSAPGFSNFLREPRLTLVLRLAGLQILMAGVSNIPLAWLQRTFQYKRYAWIQFISSAVMIAVAVVFAVGQYGYWAYVFGVLSGALVALVLAVIYLNWQPRFRMRLRWWGTILKFSGFVLMEMVFGWFFVWFDNVVVAKQLGSQAVGEYSLAFSIATMTISIPVSAVTGITLPTFSRMQNDLDGLRTAYLQGTRVIAAYALPTSFSLSLLGPALLKIVYPHRWDGLGVLLPALALYAGIGHLWVLNSDAFKAIGRPDLMMRIYLPVVFVMLPLYWWSSRFGLLVFTLARSFIVVIGAVLHTRFAARYLNLRWNYILTVTRAPLAASVLPAAVFWMVVYWTGSKYPGEIVTVFFLFGSVLVGGGIYWWALHKLAPGLTRQILNLLSRTT